MYYTNIINLGNSILLRGIDKGRRINSRIAYKPTLWLKVGKNKSFAASKWKSLENIPLEPMKFDSIYETREFIKKYNDVPNFDIYGQTYFQYAYITEFFGNKVNFNINDILIATIDIEVASDNGFPKPEQAYEEITAITLKIRNTYHVFGCKDYVSSNEDTIYYLADNEEELILSFIGVWEKNYPDIVTGWNILSFDIPYIVNRMRRIFLEDHIKRLSPWGKVQEKEVLDDKFGNRKIQIYDMFGISTLDYIKLYKKFAKSPNQESYKLDHIAFIELGERKLSFKGRLHDLYLKDYRKFIDYNIRDVSLVSMLEDKLKLLKLAITLAYENKVNFNDVLSPVRMWDAITVTHLYNRGIIVPPTREKMSKDFEGAFVKEPKVGRYEWIASYDLDGLYPHLIMMCNLGPETLVNPKNLGEEFVTWWKQIEPKIDVDSILSEKLDLSMLQKYNVCLTPNRQLFKREEQGFLAELMENMYEDRKNYKNQMLAAKKELEAGGDKIKLNNSIAMLDNFQASKKVILNAAYGAIGNKYFRFYDTRIAEAITMMGQLAIRWVQNDMNKFLNNLCKTDGFDFIIASDTDSMYLNLGPLIEKALPNIKELNVTKVIRSMDKLCEEQIQDAIKKSYERLYNYINTFAPKMSMKREALADSAIWTSKKHYLMNVWNQEGVEYDKPKLKIVGLQAVMAGSLTTDARAQIKKAYTFIIANDKKGLIGLRDSYKKEFLNLSPEQIAIPKTCNGLEKYYDSEDIWMKKTPFHVKGALMYNNLLKKMNLVNVYPEIKEGEKVKYTYLKEPNDIQCNSIAFTEELPKEFGIHKYIDYETQFQKTFIDPVETILNAIGWSFEESNTLDRFFS